MRAEPNSGGVHVEGDVSGTLIYGNNNSVTTHRTDTPTPTPAEGQRNSAEDHASVYAVKRGTMHLTVHHHGHDSRQAGDEDDGSESPQC
ncbi:hypothetical protein ACIGXM_23545 [Kitasatospora sp. NPDC052896]|uniref:hypothetical protein n=1 Tax=Kitasatospora sp. NPDC052896 TaxID=3364061 RepID=UPI0037CAA59E